MSKSCQSFIHIHKNEKILLGENHHDQIMFDEKYRIQYSLGFCWLINKESFARFSFRWVLIALLFLFILLAIGGVISIALIPLYLPNRSVAPSVSSEFNLQCLSIMILNHFLYRRSICRRGIQFSAWRWYQLTRWCFRWSNQSQPWRPCLFHFYT